MTSTLTDQMQSLIRSFGVGSVATVSSKGEPMVSPKGTFLVLSESELAFAHLRSPQTVRNIQSNPNMQVVFTDIFRRIGCRVSGRARYIARAAAEAEPYHRHFAPVWPDLEPFIKGYVILAVRSAEIVTSPVYDLGSEPVDLDRLWLRKYAELIADRYSVQ